ncbi:hypothetical protein CspHIS471_0408180 [Cutaneotrichosporon sp. HIS471]|nr:hypothetical protein CspHIS471_0408180 [Cutaneotrichosporon sp. HIS471]
MKLATLALLFVGAVSAAPAPQEAAGTSSPAERQLGSDWRDMTGCTCLGWPFSPQVFFSQANGKRDGWCWTEGNMIQRDRNLIQTAVTQNRNTGAANGMQANVWCRGRGIPHASSECTIRVINEFTRTQGPGLLSFCQYPARGTFTPTNCNCGFTCNTAYVPCGRHCVVRGTQCNGGIPVERVCNSGFWLCNNVCIRFNQSCSPNSPRGLSGVFERDEDVTSRDIDSELDERDTEDLENRSEPALDLDARDADADADPSNHNRCRPGWVWCSWWSRCYQRYCPKLPVCKKGWYWCRSRCVPNLYKCPRDVEERDAEPDFEKFDERDIEQFEPRDGEPEIDERDFEDALDERSLEEPQERNFDERDLDERDTPLIPWPEPQPQPPRPTYMPIPLPQPTYTPGPIPQPTVPVPQPQPQPTVPVPSEPSLPFPPGPWCRFGWTWCPQWNQCFRGRFCPRRCRIGWHWCRTRCVPRWFLCPTPA